MTSLFVNEDEAVPESIQVTLNQQIEDDDTGRIPLKFMEPEIVPIYPTRTVNCTLPLKYQQEIVEDMLTRDGLLVLGRGLGWEIITANLLHALSSSTVTLQEGPNSNANKEKRSLIILLNGKDDELYRIKEAFAELHWIDSEGNDEEPMFFEVSGEANNLARKEIYNKGGVMSVTSRVLVVDLFAGLLSPNDITGLFILHAERIKETSNEASIINLYRDGNDWGFIKAVTDEPESISGFAPLATTLKIIRLTNVFLWPRFHVEVSSSVSFRGKTTRQRQELERKRNVTEINVQLTYKMKKIQAAILTCIQACLMELKRHNPTLATDYWDMANAHDPNFVSRIRMNVDLQWHRLTYTSKQLVFDLGTLTNLLKSLVTLDSIGFYQVVQGIIDLNLKLSNGGGRNTVLMSPWLNLDESNTIIALSRERALGKVKVDKVEILNEAEELNDVSEDYNLEELPKWDQLGILIDDILHEKSMSSEKDQGHILIMCSSAQIVEQLRNVLRCMKGETNYMNGKKRFTFRKYMTQKLHGYLYWKEVNQLVKKFNAELPKNAEVITVENIEAESETVDDTELNISKTFTRNGIPLSKRRRTRGASASARVSKIFSTKEHNNEAAEVDESILKKLHDSVDDEEEDDVEEVEGLFVLDDKFEIGFSNFDKDQQIIIQSYNERTNDALLQELSPSYIIMYEPNISFIRRVEMYQAINKESPARTYFMYYGTSVEEEKHLLNIKKEKEAFTRLIKEKAQLGKHFETAQDNHKFKINTRHKLLNTRIAGGATFRTETDELRVVVDLREFRSQLPNLLYRIGIKVVPCMITVGDYIVTPTICVERKSITDLVESFKSGRLYQQCEQMLRHYECPTLLIEFDEGKSFSLEPFSDTRPGQKINPLNPTANQYLQKKIQSKIILLLISFPRLKIIWSSSPFETAQIFLELKANQEEPDVSSALDKGVTSSVVTEDGGPPVFNDDPIDLIKCIPGINQLNFELIISKVKNIEELVQLEKVEFEKILGEENGRKAYNFINRSIER